MVEIGTTFMAVGQEYQVEFHNEGKNRMTVIPIGNEITYPPLNQKIIINDEYYRVTYIHHSRKEFH